MKKLMFAAMLLVAGCQDAHVTSADGSKLLATCASCCWVKCVADACPNGYVVVVNASGMDSAIIECKP